MIDNINEHEEVLDNQDITEVTVADVSNVVAPCDATVEAEGNGEIRSVNKGKTRGRKAGETQRVLKIGEIIRRFSKKELGIFFLQGAIHWTEQSSDMSALLAEHGRPLPLQPVPEDISDWSKVDYLAGVAKCMS